jgi:uncharacterized repeat protein (TIGR03803 family)
VALILALLSGGGGTGASAQTLTTIYSFTGGSDGALPLAGLIADSTGAFYGTTDGGGGGCAPLFPGCGTVFKLTPPTTSGGQWTETVLYSFTGGSDGGNPIVGLIADAAGALYGTTWEGGITPSNNFCGVLNSCGTVFKLTPPTTSGGQWTESTLYQFLGGNDGGEPHGALIADASGALYGTTAGGGDRTTNLIFGTVFKLTPPTTSGGQWTEPVLANGGAPFANLIADSTGAFYGITVAGGPTASGTVFKLTPPTTSGGQWTTTVLYTFNGGSDGLDPEGALIADAAVALYGTTINGGSGTGCNGGCGTVFKLTPPTTSGGQWTQTVLYSFTGGSDGALPSGGVIADAGGALYGTTMAGGGTTSCGLGVPGCGTVFKLTPPTTSGGQWTETVLYRFTGGSDGAAPVAGLIADAAGALYGTTVAGGNFTGCQGGCGTVFKLQVAANFQGVPGQANCVGQSISFLAHTHGGIAAAAADLNFASVMDLQNAVKSFCAM